jgi:hypothetical protein
MPRYESQPTVVPAMILPARCRRQDRSGPSNSVILGSPPDGILVPKGNAQERALLLRGVPKLRINPVVRIIGVEPIPTNSNSERVSIFVPPF